MSWADVGTLALLVAGAVFLIGTAIDLVVVLWREVFFDRRK